uniref:Uncharacterized protein n=1 Tax=Siphoviridae sp. ctEP635 TaxID=2825396 RepID=A0A8S5UX57_9CAUD|nr:MAG TPA: hypothetical protein [Siphoviridae sp. ctEP635]
MFDCCTGKKPGAYIEKCGYPAFSVFRGVFHLTHTRNPVYSDGYQGTSP